MAKQKLNLFELAAGSMAEAGGELEQIQFLLGHEELETTARDLGSAREIREAVNDHLGL